MSLPIVHDKGFDHYESKSDKDVTKNVIERLVTTGPVALVQDVPSHRLRFRTIQKKSSSLL
eukprot:2315810-Amphidinium_carterae.3